MSVFAGKDAKWVSSPRSQAGALTLESIGSPQPGPRRSVLESRWYQANEGDCPRCVIAHVDKHAVPWYFGAIHIFCLFKRRHDGVVPFFIIELGRWALQEDNSMVLMMMLRRADLR